MKLIFRNKDVFGITHSSVSSQSSFNNIILLVCCVKSVYIAECRIHKTAHNFEHINQSVFVRTFYLFFFPTEWTTLFANGADTRCIRIHTERINPTNMVREKKKKKKEALLNSTEVWCSVKWIQSTQPIRSHTHRVLWIRFIQYACLMKQNTYFKIFKTFETNSNPVN